MPVNFIETTASLALPSDDNCGEYKNKKLVHICEVCKKREILTPREGFEKGWDYAPYMYAFKEISPRTCKNCSIEKTAYWQIAVKNSDFSELTNDHKNTIIRIYNEPDSIVTKE